MSQQKTDAAMRAVMGGLEQIFPGCAVALLVAPFGGPKNARTSYISNGNREDMLVMMKEVIARFEGRGHDAPASKQ